MFKFTVTGPGGRGCWIFMKFEATLVYKVSSGASEEYLMKLCLKTTTATPLTNKQNKNNHHKKPHTLTNTVLWARCIMLDFVLATHTKR